MDYHETIKRMHGKQLYFCDDEKLAAEQTACLEMLYDFNRTRPNEREKRREMLKKMLADMGENCYIEPPFHANWGGKHVHFGDNVYLNFNVTLVDDTDIFIGDNVMIAPNVTITSGTHPIHPGLRLKYAQYNLPVHIQKNVWIGANAVIMPGVTIGENSVIGAGSVVTKDVPPDAVAAGCPCKVLRAIGENDYKFYNKNIVIDIE
jgi:galactoside O-acetyltransferase